MFKHLIAIFSVVFASTLLFSCASHLEGDPIKADLSKNEAVSRYLDAVAPNGCSYNDEKIQYDCDDEAITETINKRVNLSRTKLLQHFHKDPHLRNSKELGMLTLINLYYCVDRNGVPPTEDETIIYCETPLSYLFTENKIKYMGMVAGKNKYLVN